MAVRCWTEIQNEFGISPCVAMGALNDEGLAASCEVDLGNAIAMKAISLASYAPPACMDWNNNYEDEDDKCILFHCGPAPASLMLPGGRITDHFILMGTVGEGRGFGCNQGRLKPMDFTFTSLMTEAGRVKMYLGEGKITEDFDPAGVLRRCRRGRDSAPAGCAAAHRQTRPPAPCQHHARPRAATAERSARAITWAFDISLPQSQQNGA